MAEKTFRPRLNHVAISVPDVDKAVEYYTKVLDFSLVEQSAHGAFLTTTFDHHSKDFVPPALSMT